MSAPIDNSNSIRPDIPVGSPSPIDKGIGHREKSSTVPSGVPPRDGSSMRETLEKGILEAINAANQNPSLSSTAPDSGVTLEQLQRQIGDLTDRIANSGLNPNTTAQLQGMVDKVKNNPGVSAADVFNINMELTKQLMSDLTDRIANSGLNPNTTAQLQGMVDKVKNNPGVSAADVFNINMELTKQLMSDLTDRIANSGLNPNTTAQLQGMVDKVKNNPGVSAADVFGINMELTKAKAKAGL